jgi:hypothetical protein
MPTIKYIEGAEKRPVEIVNLFMKLWEEEGEW